MRSHSSVTLLFVAIGFLTIGGRGAGASGDDRRTALESPGAQEVSSVALANVTRAFGARTTGLLRQEVGSDQRFATARESVPRSGIVTLSDLNSNGVGELAVLYTNPSTGNSYVSIKDAQTGATIRRILAFDEDWAAVGLIGLPDFSGNGLDEIAVAAQLKGLHPSIAETSVRVFDASSGVRLRKIGFFPGFTTEDLVAVPHFGGTSAWEIGLLGVNHSDVVAVQVRDASNRAKLSHIWYPMTYEPVKMVVLPDFDGTPAPEIAVLGVHSSTARVVARIKDASSGAVLRKVSFSRVYRPRDMVAVSDMDGTTAGELAVLGVESSTSRVMVRIKDASSGANLKTLFYSKAYVPRSCIAIADFAGTSAPEMAVAGRHDSTAGVLVRVKDASSSATLSELRFSRRYPPEAVTTVPDFGGSSSDEIALLGRHATTGGLLVRVKDGQSGDSLAAIPIP